MPETPIKEPLRLLLDETLDECDHLLQSLDENKRHASGTIAHWEIKDLICHIAFWTQHHAEMLAAVQKGEAPEIISDFLKVNDQVFEEHKDCTLAEAQAFIDLAYQNMQSKLAGMTEDDLRDTVRYTWTNNRPVYISIFSEAFSHPLIHLGQYQTGHGNLAEARRMNERIAAAMVDLDDTPYTHGVAAYNLACFYAISGDPARAVELLKEGLSLAPSLTDWSKEDSDLISLHGLPNYEGLYS